MKRSALFLAIVLFLCLDLLVTSVSAREPACKWTPKWMTVDTFQILELRRCGHAIVTIADQIDCEGHTRQIVVSVTCDGKLT